MEKSSYQKLRKKLREIQKWIWQKELIASGEDPTAKLLKKWLEEIQEIVDEKGND